MMVLSTLRRKIALALCPGLRVAVDASHSPPGRPSAFWRDDEEMCRFLVAKHRKVTLAQVVSQGRQIFGPRFPSKSAVHRYWQQLDRVFGPTNQKGTA